MKNIVKLTKKETEMISGGISKWDVSWRAWTDLGIIFTVIATLSFAIGFTSAFTSKNKEGSLPTKSEIVLLIAIGFLSTTSISATARYLKKIY